jgi:hypothetical protein
MKRALLATVAFACIANATPASAKSLTEKAIAAMLRANDRVQTALDQDVCSQPDDIMTEHLEARATLRARDAKSYDRVRARLGVAYAATNQTDGELIAVDSAFCEAVAQRGF